MSVLLGDDVLLSYYGDDNINSHWASYILDAAYDFGIVNEIEIQNTADSLEKFITRYEMARILSGLMKIFCLINKSMLLIWEISFSTTM